MSKYLQVITIMLLGFQATLTSGQDVSANLYEPLPLDRSITYGKLDNGLTYYIKPLPGSKEKVNLHFYIKAGSNHQDPDQLNMAHIVEHMAFKSSKHFPKGIFHETKTNKSLDMEMSDTNGSAGTASSRYNFNAPSDNKVALETGLLWFKDIATGLRFKDEEIDTERGVMVQEFMSRTSGDIQETFAKRRISSHMSPCKVDYSNFMEHHETFDPERLKQFYKDWYRPDLMAIVIVGKVNDVDGLEKKIINQFSDIPLKENPRELPDCEALYFNRPPQFIVAEKKSDSELSDENLKIELLFRDKKTLEMLPSQQGVKRMNEIDLFLEVFNNRLREAKRYGSFFDFYIIHNFKRIPSSFKALLNSYNNSEKEALQTFIGVLEQLNRYGVTESEFILAKKNRIDQLENMEVGKSRYWIDGISDYLIYRKALPSDRPGFVRNWLSDYELSEFKEFIKGINFEMPDIGIIAPTGHPTLSYREAEIRSWISEVRDGSIVPYVQPEVHINLMGASEVENLQEFKYEDKGIRESGAREIILANGVKLFLKSFKPSSGYYQNKIMLQGFNSRGALNFPAEDYFSAINAPQFMRHSGVGKFNKFDLQQHFSTNSLVITGINLYVNNQEAGVKSYADIDDIEKMLQLVYLSLSQPRQDNLAFEDWRVQEERSYQSQFVVEQNDFEYNIRKFIRDNSGVSRGTERHRGLAKTNMEKGYNIFKELFGNAQDFTFTLTGDFPIDVVLPLMNKYLGNLPSFQSDTNTKNRNVFTPKPVGPVFTQFKFPDAYTKSNYLYWPFYLIPAKEQDNWKEKLLVRTLGRMLNTKVWALRTEKGYALYNVSAYGKYDLNMNQYEFAAMFNCTPEEYPQLRQEFSSLITELKSELVSEDLLKKIVHEIQDWYNVRINAHGYIYGKLYNHLRFDEPWLNEAELIPYLESLSPEDLLKAAQKYFKSEHLYEFVMKD